MFNFTRNRFIIALAGLLILGYTKCLTASPSVEDPGELVIRDVVPLSPEAREALSLLIASSPDAAVLLEEKKQAIASAGAILPNPIPVMHYEGLLNSDPKRIETVKHLHDMDRCAARFEIWQATGDSDAAEYCRRFILAWSGTYRPIGNDVNEYKLLPLLVAYESLRPTFDPACQKQVDAWVREIGELHLAGIRDKSKATGNRYAKRLRLIATTGLTLNEEGWIDEATIACKNLITQALYADGQSHDLLERDTLTYHTTTLRPLLDLALLTKRQNIDLYTWESPKGGSLKKSIDYLRPYITGEKTHKEWVNTKAEIDKKRAQAGIPHYQPGILYDPRQALPLLSEAELFDPGLNPLVRKFGEKPSIEYPVWRLVLNDAIRGAEKENKKLP